MIGGGPPLLPKILGQPTPINHRFWTEIR